MTLGGFQLVDPTAPVAHVSYFEADAFAAWSGKRLPSEAEWEVATQRLDVEGNFLDLNRLRPKPASPRKAGVQQMFGASNDSRRRFRSRASISGELPVGSGISSARVGQEWGVPGMKSSTRIRCTPWQTTWCVSSGPVR